MDRIHYFYLFYIKNGKLNFINQVHLLAYLLFPENQSANLNPSPTLPIRKRRYLTLVEIIKIIIYNPVFRLRVRN